eukprot:8716510-Ditylum_brightwellii.AAC.1
MALIEGAASADIQSKTIGDVDRQYPQYLVLPSLPRTKAVHPLKIQCFAHERSLHGVIKRGFE